MFQISVQYNLSYRPAVISYNKVIFPGTFIPGTQIVIAVKYAKIVRELTWYRMQSTLNFSIFGAFSE